jgi:D-glycero-D-manno-heptose 1,7-bisphosphate phosphatase
VLLVVTNQPDVARGTTSRDAAMAITEHVVMSLGLEDGYLCLHDRPDGCNCRKPEPGMLVAAARDWNVTLETSWLIGDRWVDIAAAHAAGVRSVLLDRPYSWSASGGIGPRADLSAGIRGATLSECVDRLLGTLALE